MRILRRDKAERARRMPPLRHFAYLLATVWAVSAAVGTLISLAFFDRVSVIFLVPFLLVVTIVAVISLLSQRY